MTPTLLMNAMYDAPVDELGNPIMNMVSRTKALTLVGQSRIRFLLGYDSDRCVVQATDYFGSLDKQKLFARLAKVYRPDEYELNQRTAGAGLGLATLYRSGASLFFDCQSRTQTQVTALFSLKEGNGKSRTRFQAIVTRFA